MSGDYISREAAMPDGFCVGVSCQECPFCDDPIEGGCKVARFIDAIPAADVVEWTRWVSVTERLPSPMRAVLVWAPYKHNIFMAYLQGNKWYVWGPDDICCHNWPEYHAITHWMPLPEPPKEEA